MPFTEGGLQGSRHNPKNTSPPSKPGKSSGQTASSPRPRSPATTSYGRFTLEVPMLQTPDIETDFAPESLLLAPVHFVSNTFTRACASVDAILLQHTGQLTSFSTEILAAGIAHNCSAQALRQYLDSYPAALVKNQINNYVHRKQPGLFYAVTRNCVECVKLLIEYGADVNVLDSDNIPCLAFAVMICNWTLEDPAETVKILVAFGASSYDVPEDLWSDYLQAPSVNLASAVVQKTKSRSDWCTPAYRKLLVSAPLNLSVRYYLHKAADMALPTARAFQVAKDCGYTALLKVPYLIIGQRYATLKVVRLVSAHIAMCSTKPLVLVFAGPSGHGKTELAKQMGDLLNLPMTIIDCGHMTYEMDLFGPHAGLVGCEGGSQLNNHLAQHSARSSVVFLDEFDKTNKNIYDSLLLLLDSGEYHDRRTNTSVDASKTIWVLATNLGDQRIDEFYSLRLEETKYADRNEIEDRECSGLTTEIKALFAEKFGAPMAGRMKNVVPFFPFSIGEQAVIAHKFLTQLGQEVGKPIDLASAAKRHPGHIYLAIKNDGKLCERLAQSYIRKLGARSLGTAIDDVRSEFFATFVNTHELVTESMNQGAFARYTIQLKPTGTTGKDGKVESDVEVVRDGHAMPKSAMKT